MKRACSRYIVNWDLRESMTEAHIEIILERVTPKDMLAGRQQEIHTERDRKLEAARKQRQIRRQQAA